MKAVRETRDMPTRLDWARGVVVGAVIVVAGMATAQAGTPTKAPEPVHVSHVLAGVALATSVSVALATSVPAVLAADADSASLAPSAQAPESLPSSASGAALAPGAARTPTADNARTPTPGNALPAAASAAPEPDVTATHARAPTSAASPALGVDVVSGVHIAAELWTRAVTSASAGARRFDFDLPRVEGGAAFGSQRWWSELRVEGIRSAGQASGFGIDGDSLLLRVKRARLGGVGRVGQVWFSVEAGLVADPWLQYQDQNQAMRAWGPSLAERWLGTSSSDLGGIVQIAHRRGRLALMASNGEGRVFVERNTQKNVLAVVDAVPWNGALAGHAARVLLHAYGRKGTVGAASVHSDRVGAALRAVSRYGALHAEGGQAWGVGDNASTTARVHEASLYVTAGHALGIRGVVVGGRGQRVRFRDATLRNEGTATLWQVGVGWDNAVDVPLGGPWAQRFVRIWLVAEQMKRTGDAAPAGTVQGTVTAVYLLLASQQVATLAGLAYQ